MRERWGEKGQDGTGAVAAAPGHALDHPAWAAVAASGQALLARFLVERDRWVLWTPVLFGLGIGLYFNLSVEPPVWTGASVLGFLVLLAMAGRLAPPVLVPTAALFLVAAGFTAGQVRTLVVAAPVLGSEMGGVDVIGTVRRVEPRDRGVRLIIGNPEMPALDPDKVPARVRVTVANGAPGIEAGDRVKALTVLRPPPTPVAPGAFDFARRAYFQRIGAVGFVLGSVEALPGAPRDPPFLGIAAELAAFRHDLAETIRSALPGEPGAVAAALMTGERGAVSQETMTALRDAGLAHLLAISGLHVGLVAGLIFAAVRLGCALVPPVALRLPTKKLAAVLAGLAAGGYLLLVGATVPTQRAFLMTAIVLLGVAMDRTALSMRLVAFAAFAVLLLRPESLLSVSFQMSFAAATALIATYEALRGRGAGQGGDRGTFVRIALYLGGVALTSVVAAAATAPFAVFHFNRVALYGLAANMLAVPAMAFWVMPVALVAYALLPLGAADPAFAVMGAGIAAIIEVAHAVAAWPGAAPVVPSPPMSGLLILVAGGLWLCLWRRRWRLLGLPLVLAGAASLWLAPTPDVLVGRDAELMAVRDRKGRLLLSTDRRAKFSAGIWLRRAGQESADTFPAVGGAPEADLTCDPLSCIYRRDRHVVALVRDARALHTDCARATLILATVPVRRADCAAPLAVVDRFDIWREGGHAVHIEGADWRITSVGLVRGERPWVVRRDTDQ